MPVNMDIKRTKKLAGITEQTRFRDAGEMLRSVLAAITTLKIEYQKRVSEIERDTARGEQWEEAVALDKVIDDLDTILLQFKEAQVTPRR